MITTTTTTSMSAIGAMLAVTVMCWTLASVSSAVIAYNALNYHQISDVCDWEGSGSIETDSDRVVVPVYLRCSHGSIKWLYPKGGLRVVLRYSTSNREFRGCIRVARNTSRSVRLYVEGHKQLHPLYSYDDHKDVDLLRCFVSIGGQIAIFVESEPTLPNDLIHKDIVQFSYDLQSVSSKEELMAEDQECKPCDDSQVLSLFCSSDIIIEGTIESLFHNQPLQRSEVTVRAQRVIKDPADNRYETSGHNHSISVDAVVNDLSATVQHYTLYRPLKCHTKAGSGQQFLMLGRWLLGYPYISCAPTLTHWKQIKTRALESQTNECHLI